VGEYTAHVLEFALCFKDLFLGKGMALAVPSRIAIDAALAAEGDGQIWTKTIFETRRRCIGHEDHSYFIKNA
jgi:hypothetical protein